MRLLSDSSHIYCRLLTNIISRKAAIARFRAYKPPPFPLWDRLPVRRRAAVLVLLYADRRGDLRVVITMRAASLRNFSGHAAFPGGKADDLEETPCKAFALICRYSLLIMLRSPNRPPRSLGRNWTSHG